MDQDGSTHTHPLLGADRHRELAARAPLAIVSLVGFLALLLLALLLLALLLLGAALLLPVRIAAA